VGSFATFLWRKVGRTNANKYLKLLFSPQAGFTLRFNLIEIPILRQAEDDTSGQDPQKIKTANKYFSFSFVLTQKKQKVKTSKSLAKNFVHFVTKNELPRWIGVKQHSSLNTSFIHSLTPIIWCHLNFNK